MRSRQANVPGCIRQKNRGVLARFFRLFRINDFFDADCEAIIDDDHFTTCQANALHDEIDRLGNGPVELQDRADTQFQDVADGESGPPKFRSNGNIDVE